MCFVTFWEPAKRSRPSLIQASVQVWREGKSGMVWLCSGCSQRYWSVPHKDRFTNHVYVCVWVTEEDCVCVWVCPTLLRPVKSDGTSKLSSPNKLASIDIEHNHHVTVNLSSRPAPTSGQSCNWGRFCLLHVELLWSWLSGSVHSFSGSCINVN